MTSFLGWLWREWGWSLLNVPAILLLQWVLRRAKERRLIARLTVHRHPQPSGESAQHRARLLLHNGEQSLDIEGIDICFRSGSDSNLGSIEKVLISVGPHFDAEVGMEPDATRPEALRIRSKRKLKPGRSWLFAFDLPRETQRIQCTIQALPSDGHSSRARTLTAKQTVGESPDVDYVDTLNPAFFIWVIGLAAFLLSSSLMWFLLVFPPVRDLWAEFAVLACATVGAGWLLQRLVRPSQPVLALGYREERAVSVRMGITNVVGRPSLDPPEVK